MVIQTKLNPPRVPNDVVPRERLYERMTAGCERPLTLVCAPAGFGKSLLVVDWASETGRSLGWVSLDEHDSDFRTFVRYFVTAVRSVSPEACPETEALLDSIDLPPVSTFGALLANELDEIDSEFSLVLDDYHRIHEVPIHELLTFLLRHPPRSLHLVIVARADPPLPLQALRARGQMSEIRAADLEFTRAEVAEFFARSLARPLREQTIELLRDRTEGWVLGIRLAALTMRHDEDVDRLLAGIVEGGFAEVEEYLVSEFLAGQSPAHQACLLRTSILDRFCAPLCQALFEVSSGDAAAGVSGQEFVDWLTAGELPVNSLNYERTWFRYHHLFQATLQNRLNARLDSAEVASLHLRAAEWLEEEGHTDEALSHYMASNDETAAAGMIKRQRHALMNREEWARLDRWLRSLPEHVVSEDVELQLQRAWICENRFRHQAMLAILQRLAPLFEEGSPGAPADAIRGEYLGLSAARCWLQGDFVEGAALGRRALATIPPDHRSERGFCLVLLAVNLQSSGEFERAQSLVLEALEEQAHRGSTYHGRILTTLCFINWMEANPRHTIRFARELLNVGEQNRLAESISFARYFLGIAHYDLGDLDAAMEALRPLLSQTAPSNINGFAYGSLAFALTSVAQRDFETAMQIVENVTMRSLEFQNSQLWAVAHAFEAEILLRQDRVIDAAGWATSFEPVVSAPYYRFYVPELTLVKYLHQEGSPESLDRAAKLLARLRGHASRIHNRRILIEVLILQALVEDRAGREAALATLECAVDLASPRGLVRPFQDAGPEMAALLRRLGPDHRTGEFVESVLSGLDGPIAESAVEPVPGVPAADELTDRELEILALLAERQSNKEIAERLFISPATVKRHTVNIYQKLGVHGRRAAVTHARSKGILSEL